MKLFILFFASVISISCYSIEIMDGKPTVQVGNDDFVCRLRAVSPKSSQLCTGVLISKDVVLTAKHCIAWDTEKIYVGCGYLKNKDEVTLMNQEQRWSVIDNADDMTHFRLYQMSENWKVPQKSIYSIMRTTNLFEVKYKYTVKGDIAAVFIDGEHEIAPIGILSETRRNKNHRGKTLRKIKKTASSSSPIGQNCRIAGYGDNSQGDFGYLITAAYSFNSSYGKKKAANRNNIVVNGNNYFPTKLFAAPGQGDSGGPIYCDFGSDGHKLIGIMNEATRGDISEKAILWGHVGQRRIFNPFWV